VSGQLQDTAASPRERISVCMRHINTYVCIYVMCNCDTVQRGMQKRFVSGKLEESGGASVVASLGLLLVGTEEDDEIPYVSRCNDRDCKVEHPE
jgi:hypothetical protein